MIYIMNKHGHYFVVTNEVELDTGPLTDCIELKDLRSLYNLVKSTTGMDISDVEDSYMVIRKEDDDFYCVCPRGIKEKIEGQTVEDFIKNFEL